MRRWQLGRRRDVAEGLAQPRQQLRRLRRVAPERLAEHLSLDHAGARVEDFDEGDVGWGAFHLVAVASEGQEATGAGLGHDLLGKAGLADAGLAREHRHGTAPAARRLEQPA